MLDAGCWMLDAVRWIPDAQCRMLDAVLREALDGDDAMQ